jgi:hypothetical protein
MDPFRNLLGRQAWIKAADRNRSRERPGRSLCRKFAVCGEMGVIEVSFGVEREAVLSSVVKVCEPTGSQGGKGEGEAARNDAFISSSRDTELCFFLVFHENSCFCWCQARWFLSHFRGNNTVFRLWAKAA